MGISKFELTSRRLMVVTMASILSTNVLADRAEDASWTTNDIEDHWAFVCETATRTSTSPRFAAADEAEGEGVLEAFGMQYLPNAYAHYQEVRATAKEREQVLKETFPDGRSSDPSGGALYDKVCKATAKAVAEMFRRHDELCHFLLLHRTGAVSDEELANLDATKIVVVLPDEWELPPAPSDDWAAPVLEAAEIDFASKYLPETYAAFQRLGNAFSEGLKTYGEWRKTALLVDAPRSSIIIHALLKRLGAIQGKMGEIVKMVKEQKLLHAVGEATATTLAEADKEEGLSVQQGEKELAVGPLVNKFVCAGIELVKQRSVAFMTKKLVENMVKIPGRSFLMGKYEVTQWQWEAVMGENPSRFKGADKPVECVSWDDCQEVLRKLNELPASIKSGLTFRLPTEEEWAYTCRAGATGEYCRLADGTEITKETLGKVAWFEDNADRKTHPVGQKTPNAFGLYDMHGNVWEWTSTADDGRRVYRGGCCYDSVWDCESSDRLGGSLSSHLNFSRGFRLCASGKAD